MYKIKKHLHSNNKQIDPIQSIRKGIRYRTFPVQLQIAANIAPLFCEGHLNNNISLKKDEYRILPKIKDLISHIEQ